MGRQKKRVKKSCTRFAQYNRILDIIEARATELIVESYTRPMTNKEFAEKLFHKQPPPELKNNEVFFSFAESELTKYKEYSTYKKVKSQIHNLKQFVPVLKFSKINSDFLERYDHYLEGYCHKFSNF